RGCPSSRSIAVSHSSAGRVFPPAATVLDVRAFPTRCPKGGGWNCDHVAMPAGGAFEDDEFMQEMQLERAVGMFRTCLREYAADKDWSEHRWGEVAEVVRECFNRAEEAPAYAPALPEHGLTREELRCVVRFVNDNLDSRLTWNEIADGIGMDRCAFGRRFR